jgi:hypothetical protein
LDGTRNLMTIQSKWMSHVFLHFHMLAILKFS